MKKPTETDLVRQCIQYLTVRGHNVWRQNSGAMVVVGKNGKRRCVRFSSVHGISDIIGIAKGGKFLAVECKMPGKAPTLAQFDFLSIISRTGGIGVWVSDVKELEVLGL